MKDLTYETVVRVLDTWEEARRVKGDEVLGNLIVERFLVLEPKAEASLIKGVKQHGNSIVSLFDTLFQLLGPDMEFLQEICHQVGQRHKKMGIQQAYFPKMGLALLYALQNTLQDQHPAAAATMTDADLDAWRQVYKTISDEIMLAMR